MTQGAMPNTKTETEALQMYVFPYHSCFNF
jgi:hypothetical protein